MKKTSPTFPFSIENRGSPDIEFHVNPSKFDRGIFAQKSLLVSLCDDSAFPANSRPLHWSWTLDKKDEYNVPIKVKCETSAAGGETTVMIEYNAFSLFNLENVQISVPIKSGEAHIDEPVNGSCWYDAGNAKGQAKVHWSIPAIGDKNQSYKNPKISHNELFVNERDLCSLHYATFLKAPKLGLSTTKYYPGTKYYPTVKEKHGMYYYIMGLGF